MDEKDQQDLLEAEKLIGKTLEEGVAYLQAKWRQNKQPPPRQ